MDNKTKRELLEEIENALGAVAFGSVEIYVQDSKVTQISVRNIKKTSLNIPRNQQIQEVGTHEQKEDIPTDTQNKHFTISARFRRTE